ncbi:divalent metal cation transporter [Halobaculum sp. MBLA0147]|uniref:divalent metal cation transporter n=1 Tax=Halobaculum sp. MBLA0147 TaxID=3079934 RepID=UPI003525D009
MGPSWVAGAVAAGPATMASLVTAGATFGYDLLWVVICSALFGSLAQYLAVRVGLATERGIVSAVRTHLGRRWAWLLVVDTVLAAGLAQLVITKGLADVSAAVTGVDGRAWGVVWAVVLAVGLAGRGYRFVETVAKLLVAAVVVAFLASLAVVPVDPVAAAGGVVPSLPGGVDGALVAAGILGGAVHVTLVTMHTYTIRARGWTTRDAGLATFDVGASMLVAFGVYSLAVFLVAASVFAGADVAPSELTALSASQALGPLVGASAEWLFLLGLLGAALSTLGGNTVAPPFVLADALGWDTDVSDDRYRALLAGFALLSALGPFVGGAFFPLLVLVLAFGLVGTPFALVVVLAVLHADGVPTDPSRSLTAGGVVLVLVTAVLAGNFARGHVTPFPPTEPLSVAVTLFAVGLGLATLGLVGDRLRRRVVDA